jgi:hypothetical protein
MIAPVAIPPEFLPAANCPAAASLWCFTRLWKDTGKFRVAQRTKVHWVRLCATGRHPGYLVESAEDNLAH